MKRAQDIPNDNVFLANDTGVACLENRMVDRCLIMILGSSEFGTSASA
jgi:hypothetical protein